MARSKKHSAKESVLRYRVTQPQVASQGRTAHFPEFTTRIGSNERYIFAANHPSWHEAAERSENGLVAHLNEEAVRALFVAQRHLLREITPIVLYGFVLIRLTRQFVDRNLDGDQVLRSALNNALGTVGNNLAQVIFQDPRNLAGEEYCMTDFLRWQRNFAIFENLDVFAYRPPETGIDLDGRRKRIIELCPTPRLGRHLMRLGYRILVDHVSSKCPEQADLARRFAALQATDPPMCICRMPFQQISPASSKP